MAVAVSGPDNARLDIVEHDVKGIKSTLNQVVDKLGALTEAVLQMPKQSSVHTQVKTIGVTVAICSAFVALANGWFDSRITPFVQTLSRVERSTDDVAVLRYRIELLEKKSP